MTKSWWKIVLSGSLITAAWGGTFGKIVSIGGHASDLALDESRGVLYIANFTANRIEVMSLGDGSIQTSINVAVQPGSIALSPDGRHLVVTHFGNFQAPNSSANALTVIDLNNGNSKQTFAMGSPPLGVGFGVDSRALLVTSTEFILFDPLSGTTQVLDTISNVVAKTLPVPPANFPPQVVTASVAASGDGLKIFGLLETLRFVYDVTTRQIVTLPYISSPPLGPRVISVNRNGSMYAAGWAVFDWQRGFSSMIASFRDPTGDLNVGSHAIDSARGLLYAQVPEKVTAQTGGGSGGTGGSGGSGGTGTGTGQTGSQTPPPPVLTVYEADNLTVVEKFLLPENLAGKSVLNADGSVLYAASDSGVLILPVGSISQARRVVPVQEDLVFRGNFCDRRVASLELTLTDPGGGNTPFSLSSTLAGVTISPNTGVTPATVTVRVDPTSFQNQKGTIAGEIKITSPQAVNVPPSVRLLVNMHEPDQRGSFFNLGGRLVDLLADPTRDRFYVLRRDKNQVLVYDGASYSRIATLRTVNDPTQMALTFDRRYLLVGSDSAHIASVFDLETLEPTPFIRFPGSHYPRSLAAAGRTILAATRVAGSKHVIDRVDLSSRTAQELPSLGVYANDVDVNTVLVASPNGSSILAAQATGGVLLYNANVDSFTISRKDFTSLSGAYAASSFDQFVVGNNLLNSSLVAFRRFETGTGSSSGFSFVDLFGFRTTAASASTPGVIQRVDLNSGEGVRATRMVEAPLISDTNSPFTRTLAPLYGRNAIVSLTTSGFTVLPWNYDTSVLPPKIERVVNAADLTALTAPGGLITVTGRDLSAVNLVTREMPLPTALGESCLTVNGMPVPMLFVSPNQVNAQLPFQAEGNVTMILRTPGGVSDNFNLTILPAAPSVFRSGVAGPDTNVPTVIRDRNNALVTPSNPVHRGDTLVIYATGLGRTSPSVEAGVPAPGDPLSATLIPPDVTLGGHALPVTFAGLAPGQVGVYQINAVVPGSVPLGMEVPLSITQSGGSTSINVRVIE